MPTRAIGNSPYNISNYQPADFDKYVLLIAEAERLNPTGRCTSPQAVAEQLGKPNYSPEQDLFILWSDNIAGYIDIKPELGIRRAILDCWIHPEHRGRGLSLKLFSYAMSRARELGAEVVHVNIREDNVVAALVLHRLGFHLIRQYLELRLDITPVGELDIPRTDPGSRYLQHGEEGKLTQLQNLIFQGTWGYNPNTIEEIIFRINSSNCSPEDITLINEKGKYIGYCWIVISCEEGIPSMRKGRILMLGVAPDYRGKGIGRKLMLAGLARLRSKGLQVAELTVDIENKAACALYQSFGFEVQAKTSWYEKVINQDTGIR